MISLIRAKNALRSLRHADGFHAVTVDADDMKTIVAVVEIYLIDSHADTRSIKLVRRALDSDLSLDDASLITQSGEFRYYLRYRRQIL